MRGTCKSLSVLLIILLVVSIGSLQTKLISAQTIPKPSVPEFSVKIIRSSYNVVDAQTGQFQQIDNSSIEFTVRNQPFNYSFNNTIYHLYYKFQMKSHLEANWTEQNPVLYWPNSPYNYSIQDFSRSFYIWDDPPLPVPSNSDYTVVTYVLNASQNWGLPEPPDSQIDFQAQTIIGHDSQRWVVEHPLNPGNGGYYTPAIAYDTDSGWSPTQTVTIPASSPIQHHPFQSFRH